MKKLKMTLYFIQYQTPSLLNAGKTVSMFPFNTKRCKIAKRTTDLQLKFEKVWRFLS